jgi:hypothetical protein
MRANVGLGAGGQKGVPGGGEGGKMCLLTIIVITSIVLVSNREVDQ